MDESTILIHQAQAGMGIVAGIEFLKAQGWFPWLTASSDTINRAVAVLAAFLVSVGITWTGGASTGWVIHVPPADQLLHAFGHFLGQAGFQQWFYQQVKPVKPAPAKP